VPRPDAHVLECAFTSNPDDQLEAQVWEDITPFLDVQAGVRITRGRTDEFSEIQPSTLACTLRNDGRFTPDRNRNMVEGDDSDFATGLGGWVVSTGCTIAQVTSEFYGKTVGSLRITSTGTGTAEAKLTSSTLGTNFRVRGDRKYKFGFASKSGGPNRQTQLVVNWYDSLGGYISSSVLTRTDDPALFTYVEGTFVSPTNAYKYELFAQVLTPGGAGELHYFDVITASTAVYFPNVKSGKKIRYGVLWKGNGKNLDTDPSFNGAAPFQGSNDRYPWESVGTVPVTIESSTAFAQSGTSSMRILLSAGAAGANKIRKKVYGTIAGRQYTASLYLRVGTGDPAMKFSVTGAGSSLTTTLNAFERESVTFTATGPYCELVVETNAAAVGTEDIFVDAVQVEEGAVATTFESTSAKFTWRFTGEVNEWPTEWLGGPALLALSNLSATDQFKRLGDLGELSTTLDEDILDDTPAVYYPLNEPAGVAGSTISAGDASGNDETPLVPKQYGGGGSITFGQEVGIPDFYVNRRTSVYINPASAGNGSYLRASLKTPMSDPRGLAPTDIGAGSCINVFAQESTSILANSGPLAILSASDGSWFGVRKSTVTGNITACFYDGVTGLLTEVDSGIGMSTTSPRMYTATLKIESTGFITLTFYSNAVQFGSSFVIDRADGIPAWNVVSVGGRGAELARAYLSNAAFYGWPTTTGAITGWWYSAFRGTDGAGSTSYARMAKLVVYTNLEQPLRWSNPTAGFIPKPVGPQEIEGQPLEAIRKIEATEDGQFFIRGDGQAILLLRAYRYNRAPSLTIESERLDPDAVSFRGDDFGLVNDVTATRSDGATARIVNKASRQVHGRRKAQRDTIATTDDELRALAAWQANAWGTQRNRITGVKISLLNDSSVVNSALGLEIGQKIRIQSLPSQAPSSTVDLFVEGWTEVIAEEEWSMAFNTSPSEMYDVWQIGVAGHSEIGVTTRIGH
jgi:hypothetical protein